MNKGNYLEAQKNFLAALKIRKEIDDKQGIAASYNNLGEIYRLQGNYPEALKNYFASLKIREDIKDKKGISATYNNIGVIYFGKKNYPEALKNFLVSLKIKEEIDDKQGIGASNMNVGNVYCMQGNYPEAIENYFAALKVREEIGDKEGIAASLINLGNLYRKLAAKFFNLKGGTTDKFNQNRYPPPIEMIKRATDYLNKGLQLSKEIGSKEWIRVSYSDLAILDSLTGNYKAAFEHHKLNTIYRDSLNNEETKKKSLQTSMQYEFDKKEIAAKAEQDKLDAINAEEKKKQQLFLILVTCILVLVLVFAVFMYNRFRITQKQKVVIEEQKVLVDKAYEELHEKNKEVMDSIRYAKRIQTALITSEKSIANSLNRLMKNN